MFGGFQGGGNGGFPLPFNMFMNMQQQHQQQHQQAHQQAQQQHHHAQQQQQQQQFGPGQQPHGMDLLNMMLGQGGAVDPAVLQEVMGAAGGMEGLAGLLNPQQQAQQAQPERAGPPPTAAATLRSLPRIKVTAYDIATNEGSECSICLGDLVAGEPALRIPCGHLFHEDCVKDWLKKSNECPVCRFELPTDDAEYERGRRTRMAGRKIRMRRTDLDVKSVQELQRLANFIAVDVRGCLEKSELVERIASSPKVQIVAADAASDPIAAAGAPTFSSSQLDAMSIGEVRALLQRFSVDASGCEDKTQMLARLQSSGRILLAVEQPGSAPPSPGAASAFASASGPPAPGSPLGPPTGAGAPTPLASKSVAELRRLARQHNISLDGCLEKAEIVQRLQAACGP